MIKRFYTETLARLYEKQGYLDEAENAFQALILEEPDNEKWREELKRIKSLRIEPSSSPNDIKGLLIEWVCLVRQVKKIEGLQ